MEQFAKLAYLQQYTCRTIRARQINLSRNTKWKSFPREDFSGENKFVIENLPCT